MYGWDLSTVWAAFTLPGIAPSTTRLYGARSACASAICSTSAQLRRSLARLNDTGLAKPVTFADILVTRQTDGATADITIPLRTRGRRWWSLSGPIIPGLGSYQASISARLPTWGRGALDASTYLFTFNVLALARSSLGVVTFMSKAPPAVVLL